MMSGVGAPPLEVGITSPSPYHNHEHVREGYSVGDKGSPRMQSAHWLAAIVVVVVDVAAAAVEVPKSSTEGPTKEPRAGSVGAAEVECHSLHLSLHHDGCSYQCLGHGRNSRVVPHRCGR